MPDPWMFGDTRHRFEPGPAWQARHAHPFTSQDATSAARALLNALGPDRAEAWAQALMDNIRIERGRDQ